MRVQQVPNSPYFIHYDGEGFCCISKSRENQEPIPESEMQEFLDAVANGLLYIEKERKSRYQRIAKIETASGVTLVLNGNTVFASDDTSYWLQGAKVIGDDGHVYGHAETIRDALCLVLAKYGGLKGNSARQTKPIKAVRAW